MQANKKKWKKKKNKFLLLVRKSFYSLLLRQNPNYIHAETHMDVAHERCYLRPQFATLSLLFSRKNNEKKKEGKTVSNPLSKRREKRERNKGEKWFDLQEKKKTGDILPGDQISASWSWQIADCTPAFLRTHELYAKKYRKKKEEKEEKKENGFSYRSIWTRKKKV